MGKNAARALEMAEIAAEKGAKVIAFPELCLFPWFPREERSEHFAYAQGVSDGLIEPFISSSLKRQTVIVLPFFEISEERRFNSAAVIDCGKVLGVYRKVHIPNLPLYREQFYFAQGDTNFPVFATSRGRIGVQICWDNLFPEGSRVLALRGADVIIAPTAASQDRQMHWERAITANAFANNIHIFRVNRVGREDGIAFYGRSFCADPWGEMVSELAGSREAIVLADIDEREREAARKAWGFLQHRKPGEYGDIVK